MYSHAHYNIFITIIERILLKCHYVEKKTSRTLYISQRYKIKNWCSSDSVQLSQVRETAKRWVFSRRR